MKQALLAQLPVPGFRWPRLDSNIPLAAGYLAAWARARVRGWDVSVLPWSEADLLGDEALRNAILSRTPDLVGFTLCVWNAERSLHLARQLAHRGIRVVVGGPEVSPDNRWLWDTGGFEAAVEGEGEQAFANLLRGVSSPDPGGIPSGPTDLAQLESPYLSGLLAPYPDGSVWIESVRGCAFRCAYCNYGKQDSGQRPFPRDWLPAHLNWAQKTGARDVYLMDPSFNVRRDWEEVLTDLESGNRDGILTYHTEIIAEALRGGDAARLARSGLASCEVGLQSIHPDVLSAAGRHWDRDRWLRRVRELLDCGVSVVVGLIAGLPGDSPDRFGQTLDFVLERVPGVDVQVFPLALLPGTRLRACADKLGLVGLNRPPYTVMRTPGYASGDLAAALERFETLTGVELDPLGPPDLSGPWTGGEDGPYLSGARLDASRAPEDWIEWLAGRAARNFTLWVQGWSIDLPDRISRLAQRLPHGVLTVILEAGAGWSPQDLDRLLAAGTGRHYLDRHLRLLYGPGARVVPRLVVLAERGALEADADWVSRVTARADLIWVLDGCVGWEEQTARLAAEGETVYVRGPTRWEGLPRLAEELGADARGVVFSALEAQEAWEALTEVDGYRAVNRRVSIP